MNPGKPRKSASLKLIMGNQGKHQPIAELEKAAAEEVKPDPILEFPKPPRKLKAEGLKEWNRIVLGLVKTRCISIEMLSILATYCNVHASIVKLERKNEIIPSSLLGQYRLLAESFGLTPRSLTGIKSIGNGEEKNDEEKRFFG